MERVETSAPGAAEVEVEVEVENRAAAQDLLEAFARGDEAAMVRVFSDAAPQLLLVKLARRAQVTTPATACIEPAERARYGAGLVPARRQVTIASHLASCPRCGPANLALLAHDQSAQRDELARIDRRLSERIWANVTLPLRSYWMAHLHRNVSTAVAETSSTILILACTLLSVPREVRMQLLLLGAAIGVGYTLAVTAIVWLWHRKALVAAIADHWFIAPPSTPSTMTRIEMWWSLVTHGVAALGLSAYLLWGSVAQHVSGKPWLLPLSAALGLAANAVAWRRRREIDVAWVSGSAAVSTEEDVSRGARAGYVVGALLVPLIAVAIARPSGLVIMLAALFIVFPTLWQFHVEPPRRPSLRM